MNSTPPLAKIFLIPKSTHHHTNKLIVESVGVLFQKISKNYITMYANLISIPRTPVVKEWVEIIELKKWNWKCVHQKCVHYLGINEYIWLKMKQKSPTMKWGFSDEIVGIILEYAR